MTSGVCKLEKPSRTRSKKHLGHMLLLSVGFILSPLSWWNDAVINIPISYLLSLPFSALDERLYLPAFITIYWVTNVLGLVMMHIGGKHLLQQPVNYRLRHSLMISLIYTLLILALVLSGILSSPL